MINKKVAVDCRWLFNNLKKVRVLDGSWYLPPQRNAKIEFQQRRIPSARFFDIDAISNKKTTLPQMLPSQQQFADAVGSLGIEKDDDVVIYDTKGIFSAARVWYTFKVFGHEKVYVLNGGFPKWQKEWFPVEEADPEIPIQEKLYLANKPDMHMVRTLEEMKKNLADNHEIIVDARPADRFLGREVEPFDKELRLGHIPNSYNIPYTDVLTEDQCLRTDEEIQRVFERTIGTNFSKPIVTTCGTGMTAAVLFLALRKIGWDRVSLYDGGWAEWGSCGSDTQVTRETTPPLNSP